MHMLAAMWVSHGGLNVDVGQTVLVRCSETASLRSQLHWPLLLTVGPVGADLH